MDFYEITLLSSPTIVCTEVIWVSLGFWLFLKGKLSGKAIAAIAVALAGSVLVAWADSGSGAQSLPLWGYDLSPLVVGLLLAVFSTLLGHSIFSWCLKYFSPSFVSASKLCEPVVAAILAAMLFREFPAPVQLLGSALILGGVFWYSRLE